MKRVVVTGLGTINPLGDSVANFWGNLVAGKSAGGLVSKFDGSSYRSQVACEVKDFNPYKYLDKAEIKRTDLFTQYALYSVAEALEDAKINLKSVDPFDVGVIWGSGQGGVTTYESEIGNFIDGGYDPRRFNPFFIPKFLTNMASGMISMKYGLQGVNYTPVSACATGNTAIIDAYNYIKLGKAKVFVTGGSEAGITPASLGGFAALKAMSCRNDDPKTASRAFDQDRDGFVIGEGGAALILEEYEFAKARGAHIYAELVGTGMTADAYHITSPRPDGSGAAKAMELALKEANISASDLDYINLHATSTPVGDISELKAIQRLFPQENNLHLSATKSMTGHLLGAAGALEAIIAIMSINDNIIPPSINVFNPDPEIPKNLNIVFDKALKKEVKTAMNNSFGFGGHNTTTLFREV